MIILFEIKKINLEEISQEYSWYIFKINLEKKIKINLQTCRKMNLEKSTKKCLKN